MYTSSDVTAQHPAVAPVGSPPPFGYASMHGGSRHNYIASLRHLLASPDCESPRVAAVCHASGSATAWAVGALFLILFGGALGALYCTASCCAEQACAILCAVVDAVQAANSVLIEVMDHGSQVLQTCCGELLFRRPAGVGLPLLSKRVRWFATDSAAFVVGRAFAAGVVLATGFVHLFPDAYENLTDPCLGWGGASLSEPAPCLDKYPPGDVGLLFSCKSDGGHAGWTPLPRGRINASWAARAEYPWCPTIAVAAALGTNAIEFVAGQYFHRRAGELAAAAADEAHNYGEEHDFEACYT